MSTPAWGVIDTLEGQEITDAATIEGVDTTDEIEGQEIKAAAAGFTCDCSGTVTLCWSAEHETTLTSGTPGGCSDGDTSLTKNNSPEISTTQVVTGTYSYRINANAENYSLSLSSDDLADTEDIKVTFEMYIATFPTTSDKLEVFRVTDHSSDQYIVLRVVGTDSKLAAYGYWGGTAEGVVVTGLASATWLSCEYQAKQGVAGNDHYIACEASSTEEDDDHVSRASGSGNGSGVVYFGDVSGTGGTGDVYIDDLTVEPCDRY